MKMEITPLLSILIPTILERRDQFDHLVSFISNVLEDNALHDAVELISYSDNKEISIGKKRNYLYGMAKGLYSWAIDDDDAIATDAIPLILAAMKTDPDCITFQELCNIDGVTSRSNFSLNYIDWGEHIDGWDHVRTPFFKTPIKTSICQAFPVPDMRFGEDHSWARIIQPHLKTEVHIDEFLYYYNHQSSPYNQRYGFR